jgi:hypothetical protein
MHGWCTAREDVLRTKGWRLALRAVIRNLNPGYFAVVMGYRHRGRAMSLDGAGRLSGCLPSARIVAYVLLAASCVWRFAGYRREFLADAGDPRGGVRVSPSSPDLSGLAAHLAGGLHTSAPVSLLAIGEAG